MGSGDLLQPRVEQLLRQIRLQPILLDLIVGPARRALDIDLTMHAGQPQPDPVS